MKRPPCAGFLFLAIALLVAGCGKAAAPPPAMQPHSVAPIENPVKFPLYHGADILAVKQFTQSVAAGQTGMSALGQAAGTYAGNEVIAGSGASFGDLDAWLHQLEQEPPAGYTVVAVPAQLQSARAVAVKNSVDFAVFRDAANPKHAVVVIAMDPAAVHRKMGSALTLLSRYQSLPEGMRRSIDQQLKQRFGYSAGEFIDPGSPLGTVVSALGTYRANNERGIVEIDATKQ